MSIYCPPPHIKIDCLFVKLLINGTCVRAFAWRWVVGCFPVNFAKFLRTPFLQNTSGRLLLLRLKCKLKLWLQSKWVYTLLPWPLWHLFYKPPHLKQHHCNNSWKFKILQQMNSEYLLSTTAYQNWLLICETANKWHMCKSVGMEVSGGKNELFWDAWLVPFFCRKNSYKQCKENVFFSNSRKKLINGFFSKLCLNCIYFINNLPMQNELTFAS